MLLSLRSNPQTMILELGSHVSLHNCHGVMSVMIDLIVSRCSTHRLLLCFILLHISNGSVSTSLVGHVLYSADLMFATCTPYYYLMVHRYIYTVDTLLYSLRFTNCIIPFLPQLLYHPQVLLEVAT